MQCTRPFTAPPGGQGAVLLNPTRNAREVATRGSLFKLCASKRTPGSSSSSSSHVHPHVEIEMGKDGLFNLPIANANRLGFSDAMDLDVDGLEDSGSMDWGFQGDEVVEYHDSPDSDFPHHWGPTMALPRPQVDSEQSSPGSQANSPGPTTTPAMPGSLRIELDSQLKDRLQRALMETSTSGKEDQGPARSTVVGKSNPSSETPSRERKRTRSAAGANTPTDTTATSAVPSSETSTYSKLLAKAKLSAKTNSKGSATSSAPAPASVKAASTPSKKALELSPSTSSEIEGSSVSSVENSDRIRSLVQKFVSSNSTAKASISSTAKASVSSTAKVIATPPAPTAPSTTTLGRTKPLAPASADSDATSAATAVSGSKWGKILKEVASPKPRKLKVKVGGSSSVGAFAKRTKGTTTASKASAATSSAAPDQASDSATLSSEATSSSTATSSAALDPPSSAQPTKTKTPKASASATQPPKSLKEVFHRHKIPEDILEAFMASVDSGAFTPRSLESIDSKLGVLLEESSGLDGALVLSVLKSQPQMLQQSLELLIEKKEHLSKVLGCPSSDIGKILKASPTLWGLKIEGIISKMDALSSATGLHPAEVQRLVCRRPKLLTLKPDTCARKLDALASMLHKPRDKVVRLVCEIPTILDLNTDSLATKLRDLALMTGRSESFIGQMAATKPILLTSSSATLQASWSILFSASSSVKVWEKELERMPAATLVNLLLASKSKAMRLRYVATHNRVNTSLNTLVKMKTHQFNQLCPEYNAWFKDQ